MTDSRYEYDYIFEKNEDVDLDIIMLAYNHENIIECAIKSVLMQKTSYSYRLIIGEDCSTDKTRQIVMDYQKKYPEKISLILWKKNVGVVKNSLELTTFCRGKYVTCLEGDDYWTDTLKLEKQLSFLEKNREYIGTAHNVRCVDINGNILHRDFGLYPIVEEHIYGKEQASRFELASHTSSLIYRNFFRDWTEKERELFASCEVNGDLKLNVLLGLKGNIYFFRDIMADHRRVFKGDSWTAMTSGKNLLWLYYCFRRSLIGYIEMQLGVQLDTKRFLNEKWQESWIRFFCKPNWENIRNCWHFFKERMKENIAG